MSLATIFKSPCSLDVCPLSQPRFWYSNTGFRHRTNPPKITYLAIYQLCRQGQKRTKAIEILFLSACQTATGNDQAVMGIAGTTVQAGASSAIASLWNLDDESSLVFAKAFYQNLGKANVSFANLSLLSQKEVVFTT
ncbi:CHAT domain-containing protein [Scytonema sp. UIC 10036]|uniref:CHAT domain-containing protein n=1 Tax=Scytonema sp. UIC 10036 TaxID=2304196 RepID=UPI0012DA0276|nr:CHAT domain-containing protein [Scytonema sp. UIC 10036]MUG95054.1 CHAT domain-containing protein [Scytonema sp. UIC 10036]